MVVVGAGCAALGGLGSTVLSTTIARRQDRRHAGQTEVVRKRQLDIYEALRQLAGHIASVTHQIAWISQPDGARHDARISFGRKRAACARELARLEIANLGPEVLAAVLTATDTAEALFVAVSERAQSDVVAVLSRQWREQADAVMRASHTAAQVSEAERLQREWHGGGGV